LQKPHGLTVSICLIIIAASSLLTGCMNGLDIEIVGNDQPIFQIKHAGLLGGFPKCFGEMAVYEGSDDVGVPVWDFRLKSLATCKPIKQINYGSVPSDYEEINPPSRLVTGKSYFVIASAPGGYIGVLRFKKEPNGFKIIKSE